MKITGIVSPIRLTGGSKATWFNPVVKILVQVALLDKIESVGFRRYEVKEMTVSCPAGMVMAVMLGAIVDVAVALAELEPTTVTRTSTA